jgi:hypothetical protein
MVISSFEEYCLRTGRAPDDSKAIGLTPNLSKNFTNKVRLLKSILNVFLYRGERISRVNQI